MVDFLKRFDGSGRTPRPLQVEYLKDLAANWDKADIHAANLPVGFGKAACAKAIQLATKGAIIVPSNILMNQTVEDYPRSNFLKGKMHYTCQHGMSCQDWCTVFEQKPCEKCPYQDAKNAALEGVPTFYNPMSLYYLALNPDYEPAPVMIVDEAHTLVSMLMMLCSKRLPRSVYKFNDDCKSELYLVKWLESQHLQLNKLLNLYRRSKNFKKAAEIALEKESLSIIKQAFEEDSQNLAVWIDKGTYKGRPETFLNIQPVRPPRYLINKLLAATKIVMFSGTLFPADLEDLTQGRSYRFTDMPSPIPKERRPVYYKPVDFPLNFNTDPQKIVTAIESVLKKHPGDNAIIHVSYALSKKLAPLFKAPILANVAYDKDEVVDKFKKEGGIFLAAGCAEGIDLKGNLCRLNIIPKLLYPNLMDPVVQKRKALKDGEEWFLLQTMLITIQQVGRSTRSEDDWSNTYVLDPTFTRVYSRIKHKLPKSFCEAIKWSIS